MTSRSYRIIEHTADTGFEVWGATKEQLFESAASAFFSLMWRIEAAHQQNEPVSIEVKGHDPEELMVNFLEEFLYLYDAKGLICSRVQVDAVTEGAIRARAWLQKFNAAEDLELLGVKAVTYHQLFIGKKKGRWLAQIFLDI